MHFEQLMSRDWFPSETLSGVQRKELGDEVVGLLEASGLEIFK